MSIVNNNKPYITREQLGGGKSKRLLVPIYGAGRAKEHRMTTSSGNIQLRKAITAMGGPKPFNHGADDEIYEYIEREFRRKNNRNIVIIGYSMGGACAIRVANSLIRDSIEVDTLLTIDPVPLSLSMRAKTLVLKSRTAGIDVKKAFNFYQHSVKQTGALGGRWMNGENPYFGSKVVKSSGSKTIIKQVNLSSNSWIKNFNRNVITHLNIVEAVLGK